MDSLQGLKPECIWKHFDEIRKIPHGSKNEVEIAKYVVQVAKDCKLEYLQDEVGNVVVKKGASVGYEKASATMLQAHLDMVCEKDKETEHDFMKDPLKLRREGDYLYATGTTLGADNGIGVAALLAVMESTQLKHGPIECLFTIDEETGLNGARALKAETFSSRRLINLDSEEEGAIYIGCAGGGTSNVSYPLKWEKAQEKFEFLQLTIKGLLGGHSGMDINTGRGSAIVIMTTILRILQKKEFQFQIADFQAGDKMNAIARSATVKLAISQDQKEKFSEEAKRLLEKIRPEYGKIEPHLQIELENLSSLDQVLQKENQNKLLAMIKLFPHGMIAMNPDIPELVNTSTNMASVKFQEETCKICFHTRSSLKLALESTRDKLIAAAELAGAKIECSESYPGWAPNLDSPVLETVKKAYKEIIGRDPEVKAIHAGLECGIIGERIPGMDMVSIGPQIEHPHSPQERVKIPSVGIFWQVLTKALELLES